MCVSTATRGPMSSSPGPAAAALAEQDERQLESLRQLEHPVLLVVIAVPLRARQHGVVVVDDDGAGARLVEQGAVDRAHAGDHAVARRVLAQRLDGVALVLPRDDQRPVFLEGPGIDEAVDVLARHAVAQLPAPGDRLRPVLVQRRRRGGRSALAQVVADVIQVQSGHRGDGAARDLGLLDEDDGIALADHVARRHRDAADDAAVRGGDDVLHLHRLDDGELLALAHLVTDGDVDGDDGALDRGGDPGRAVGSGRRRRPRPRRAPSPARPSPGRHARTAPADRDS